MKKCILTAGLLLSVCFLSACGGKGVNESVPAQDTAAVGEADGKPYAEPGAETKYTAQLAGKSYEITIKREADPSQPVVRDELGKDFYDNRVEVIVLRDGEPFFDTAYTKASFRDFLTASENEGTVLLGMAYDVEKSDGHAIRLGAQVGQPGIEEGPAFCVEIPLDGGASGILRDKRQDTAGDDMMGD